MRKMFWQMAMSVDGFMEGPSHELDWHNTGDDFARYVEEMGKAIDTIVFGRKTYEMMASFWTSAEAKDVPETPMMNELPKVVFSRTLKKVDWQSSRLAKGDVVEEITKLKAAPGKDIAIFGSSDLCTTLLEKNLIDEIRVFVMPVVLGRGGPMFKNVGRRKLTLLKAEATREGNVVVYYKP